MRILFTGASSFTGIWFVRELGKAGHGVCAVMRGTKDSYHGIRQERLAMIPPDTNCEWEAPFGTSQFLSVIERHGPFDLFCHHAAEVANYRNDDFDASRALAANTHNVAQVLERLKRAGCRRLLLTGSVFEGGEGAGSEPLGAINPYGLSKELTARSFAFYAARAQVGLGKFVIANPVGPYEEPRFTSYLMKAWYAAEPARVATPSYVRDNIHVSLLAMAYARFAAELPVLGQRRFCPSGYVETQGAFAQRCAREMKSRLGLACDLQLAKQSEFPEPPVRINTDPAACVPLVWREDAAWDEFAVYYERRATRDEWAGAIPDRFGNRAASGRPPLGIEKPEHHA